jgi:hypothetical protein
MPCWSILPLKRHFGVLSLPSNMREYATIHHDFRHDVDEALTTFMSALDTSLQALQLHIPMRFS